ncbi:MAG: thiamine phosphate synthase [Alphaproteobacteria bacterium]
MAAAPRLYLVAAADYPPPEFTAALEAADVACVLLLAGVLDEDALRAAVEVLGPLAQARDVAVLLQDRAELAAETGCDGVHLSDPKDLAAARQRLGAEALVGVGCGASRHDAITAAERGADYVAFGAPAPNSDPADPALLGWWQPLMTLPCVAFGAAAPEDCARLAAAGADFVAVAVAPDLDLAACRTALETASESH